MGRFLWQQRQDIGPEARAAATTYMSGAGTTLLFGGYYATTPYYFGDTWQWDGEGWVQVADIGPSPRASVKLAYDSARQVAVLFGGFGAGAGSSYDTWEWDGEAWMQVADTGPQADGYRCAMTYDDARQVIVLEGGSTSSTGVGTWSWDGTVWTQLADSGPALREFSALATDPVRGRIVLFGGRVAKAIPEQNMWTSELEGNTWEWDGAVWRQVENSGPRARWAHALAWNGTAVVLFGGVETEGSPLRDTWAWDGEHWRQRQDIGPSPRLLAAMTGDTARGRMVLFGGAVGDSPISVGTFLGDTWEAFEEPDDN